MSSILGVQRPFVGAPMAGGASTPALVTAVARAGGLGFLAGGYLSTAAFASQLDSMQGLAFPFGVNLFVPSGIPIDQVAVAEYAELIAPEFARYDLVEPALDFGVDDDHWSGKVDLLVAEPVAVVSFTFGLPPAGDVARLKSAGTTLLFTVTSPNEAVAAVAAGADGLIVQCAAAGGHSATFTPAARPAPTSLAELVRRVGAAVSARVPLLAAGGIGAAESARDAVAAGATAVVVGTALLRTHESGANQVHKNALADPARAETIVTNAFTGRPARALANAFTLAYTRVAPLGYPAIHKLTAPLRAAALARGDAERVHLWAGTAYRNAHAVPAADVVAELTRLL